jgi:predicted ester cyclase
MAAGGHAAPTGRAAAAAGKALVRRFFEEVFNRGDLAVVDELWIADRVAGGKRATETLRTAFPDYRRTIEAQVAEGDLVVTRWTARGTHRGPYRSHTLGRTLEPTGRPVEVPGISIHRLADGRIVEAWATGDDCAVLLLLGALPVGDEATGREWATARGTPPDDVRDHPHRARGTTPAARATIDAGTTVSAAPACPLCNGTRRPTERTA